MSAQPTHPDVVDGAPVRGGAYAPPEGGLLWQASEGQVVNIGWFLLALVGFWLVLPMVIALAKAIRTRFNRYQLTSQRLRVSRGVFVKRIDDLELYRVKDISIDRPFLQQLLGRGRVILLTSDRSTPTVELNAIANPIAVCDLLRSCVEACRVAKGVREVD